MVYYKRATSSVLVILLPESHKKVTDGKHMSTESKNCHGGVISLEVTTEDTCLES